MPTLSDGQTAWAKSFRDVVVVGGAGDNDFAHPTKGCVAPLPVSEVFTDRALTKR
jgi:hypothetical protein